MSRKFRTTRRRTPLRKTKEGKIIIVNRLKNCREGHLITLDKTYYSDDYKTMMFRCKKCHQIFEKIGEEDD